MKGWVSRGDLKTLPLKQRFYACVNGSVHSYLPPCLLFRPNTYRAGFTYLQVSLNEFNGLLFLQKRIFFILLCFVVMSLIFLYQNPQWSLESIRILRHKYDLSTSDNGELNNCFISKQPTFCDRTAFPGKCISTTKKVLAVLCSVTRSNETMQKSLGETKRLRGERANSFFLWYFCQFNSKTGSSCLAIKRAILDWLVWRTILSLKLEEALLNSQVAMYLKIYWRSTSWLALCFKLKASAICSYKAAQPASTCNR